MTIYRHHSYTPELHALLRVSCNGMPYEFVAAEVAAGRMAVYEQAGALAVVSYKDGEMCIEAVEGRGGLRLVRVLTDAARRLNARPVGWVYDAARVRMVRFLGYKATGDVRECDNGVKQYKVAA